MTVKDLALYTEPYGTTGNIGENFLRLLGTPALDPLHTVIREAVQNIADAAKLGQGPEILIRVRRLTPQQRTCMRQHVFRELPEEPSARAKFVKFLSDDNAVVLEICDFRTTGLGGPTRADRIPVGTDRTDFINFLRNIGTPRDTEKGGGTYGFGKASFYTVSRCNSILVDTLVAGSPSERRLIGCHVGARFEVPEGGMKRQYTGRHWWGVPDEKDGVADPLTGEDATSLAEAVGMPARSPSLTGTSIMILDFETEGQKLPEIGGRIVESLLWSFWPRMMEGAPEASRFRCTLEVDGTPVEIPNPEDFPPLDLYCKAMKAARLGKGNDVRPIRSQRPIMHLGTLALEKGLTNPRLPLVGSESLFPAVSHHIALMRPVELVVKYLKGQALPDERLEWAGVFVASDVDEVEQAFAFSEPPAHDDWISSNLEKGRGKTFVKVALDRLEAAAMAMGELPNTSVSAEASGPPLARVAGRLGAALEGVGGDGAGPNRGGRGGGGSRPPRARASRPLFERLELRDGATVAVFSTEVRQDVRKTGIRLNARAAVSVEGGSALSGDEQLPAPEILSISSTDGSHIETGAQIDLMGNEGSYEITVIVPPDCAVTVEAGVVSDDAQ